jgi:hypothetical protein
VVDDFYELSAYELAYDEGRRWLADQATRLDALRARIGALFAVAGFIGPLLLALILTKDRPHKLTRPGVGGLIVAGASLTYMCWLLVRMWRPMEMRFVVDPRELIDGYIEATPPYSLREMRREVARHLAKRADENQVGLTRLQRLLDRAAAALLVGTLALGVAPWDVLT